MQLPATPPPLILGFPPAWIAPSEKGANPPEQGEERPASKQASGSDQTESQQEQELRAIVRRLQQREYEVIAHENAHRAVGGALVRGGGYDDVQGPDNRRYIAGGDVQIDTSPVAGDPEATMAKAEHLIRTALAPVDPSAQDLRVAGQARSMYQQASVEAQLQRYRENQATEQAQAGQLLDLVA
ncbi:MAG: hypothetical protein K0A95_02650 [Chromatiales bacterium]|nr:hypothetical protein [Gammaproteobacteria bacterium]MBW6475956.1 hypothetical protein [Chromatiales bacterium]